MFCTKEVLLDSLLEIIIKWVFTTTNKIGKMCRQRILFPKIRESSAKLTLNIRLLGAALNTTTTTSSLTRWISVVVVATVNMWIIVRQDCLIIALVQWISYSNYTTMPLNNYWQRRSSWCISWYLSSDDLTFSTWVSCCWFVSNCKTWLNIFCVCIINITSISFFTASVTFISCSTPLYIINKV